MVKILRGDKIIVGSMAIIETMFVTLGFSAEEVGLLGGAILGPTSVALLSLTINRYSYPKVKNDIELLEQKEGLDSAQKASGDILRCCDSNILYYGPRRAAKEYLAVC